MFDNHQKSIGTSYTPAVACAAAAILSPVMLIFLRPFGTKTIPIALAVSVICFGLSWINWKRSSQLSIPSFAVSKGLPKGLQLARITVKLTGRS